MFTSVGGGWNRFEIRSSVESPLKQQSVLHCRKKFNHSMNLTILIVCEYEPMKAAFGFYFKVRVIIFVGTFFSLKLFLQFALADSLLQYLLCCFVTSCAFRFFFTSLQGCVQCMKTLQVVVGWARMCECELLETLSTSSLPISELSKNVSLTFIR